MLRAIADDAREAGWLALFASCGSSPHGDPLTTITDLASGALRELGDAAESYASGLQRAMSLFRPAEGRTPITAPTSARVPPEIVLSRLLEGVMTDRPLLLALDDAHAIPAESARAIRYVYGYLAQGSLVIVCTQADDAPVPAELPASSSEFALAPLRAADCAELVRAIYPDAPDGVVEAIVDQAHGLPADLMFLASRARSDRARSAADVSSTLQAATGTELAALDTETRTFLQYCSLLEPPVEEHVLHALFPDADALARLLAGRARRYLTAHDGGLRFRHPGYATAVRASIGLEIPLRREILGALLRDDRGRLADFQQILDHAIALNETEIAHRYAVRIAEATYVMKRWNQSAKAYSDALAARWPSPERFVEFFRGYASALRGATRDGEAEALILRAMRHATSTGLADAVGHLGATLIAIQTELEEPSRAMATFERAIAATPEGGAASELLAAVATTYAGIVDERHFEEIAARLRDARDATPLAMAALHQSQALLASRLGRHREARQALDVAGSFSASQQSGLDFSLPHISLFVDFQEHGTRVMDSDAGNDADAPAAAIAGYWHYMHLVTDMARGRWDSLANRLNTINIERLPLMQQMLILAPPTAMSALTDDAPLPDAATALLRDAARRELGPSAYQLSSWYLAANAVPQPEWYGEIRRAATAFRRDPLAIDLIAFVPVAVALYAAGSDPALLAELAEEDVPPCSRWLAAQFTFARGYARTRLGLDGGAEALHDAAQRFALLGAPFFAKLAAESLGAAGTTPKQLGARSGKRRPDGLTRREAQIAELVVDGKRNREIAQILVLSERTVEAHLANAYEKLEVTSRTQLARRLQR